MNVLATLRAARYAAVGAAKMLGMRISKHSPELLIAGGIVSIVGGTIFACKATLKCDQVLAEHEDTMSNIEKAYELAETGSVNYTDKDYKHDKVVLTIRTAKNFVKLYAPAVLMIGGGIACILAAHNIMSKRYAAVVAAYNALDGAFKAYRHRVSDEFGDEYDRHFLTGSELTPVIDAETGEVKGVQETQKSTETFYPSAYARFFDEASQYWRKDPGMNYTFLRCVQNQINDRFKKNRHCFLNELYDMLDIPRTQAGSVVGWVYTDGAYIDLGIMDWSDARKRRFVNGDERSILIDPNVQGIIYDKI